MLFLHFYVFFNIKPAIVVYILRRPIRILLADHTNAHVWMFPLSFMEKDCL